MSTGGQESHRQVAAPSLRRRRNAKQMNRVPAATCSVPASADVRPPAPASSPHAHTCSNQPVLAPLQCLPRSGSHSSSEMPFARGRIGHRRPPAQHPTRLSSRPPAGQAAHIHFPDDCFSGRLADGFTPGGTCWRTSLKGARRCQQRPCGPPWPPLCPQVACPPRCAGRQGGQLDHQAARQQLADVVRALRPCWSKASELVAGTESDVLAYMGFRLSWPVRPGRPGYGSTPGTSWSE